MKQKANENGWYHLLPLIFIVSIVPLIVFLKVMPLSGASYSLWNGAKEHLDFFSYYKGIALVACTALAVLLYVIKAFQSGSFYIERKLKYYYIAAVAYIALIILSTLFSEYQSIAVSGFPDRYEGVYILISYIVVFLLTSILVNNEKHLKIMIGALFLGAAIVALIGLFQYAGLDLFKSSFGKHLIVPSQSESLAESISIQLSNHDIYSTLYHKDYVGSYMAMLFPFCFSLFILARNTKLRIFMALLSILMLISWLGCNSRAGMVGGVLALTVYLISINKIVLRHRNKFIAGLIVALAVFIGLNQVSHGYLATRAYSLIQDAGSLVGLGKGQDSQGSADIPLKDIQIDGNKVAVITSSETLNFTFENDDVMFYDTNNKSIESSYEKQDGKVTLNNSKYQDYNVLLGKMGNKLLLKVNKGAIQLTFDLKEDEINLIDNKGHVVDLKPVATWGFEGKEKLGSSRGYIWSRSLPLLKDTLILGHGPDTFAAYFPQNDIKGKMYAYDGDMWQIVDKPHNLYLQIALNTGVLSLIVVLILVGMYVVKSMRIYFANAYDDTLSKIGVSIFVAVIGYLGAAFFNDSIISVAPVFWVLLGLGVSVNHLITKQKVPGQSKTSRV